MHWFSEDWECVKLSDGREVGEKERCFITSSSVNDPFFSSSLEATLSAIATISFALKEGRWKTIIIIVTKNQPKNLELVMISSVVVKI